MKASINSFGQLILEAESELETYALKCWESGWGAEPKTSSLLIKQPFILPAPAATPVSTQGFFPRCLKELQKQSVYPRPRICERCGLGPCKTT